MNYSKHFNTAATPQNEQIPGSTQTANDAGGFAWEVDDWVKLDRFLILGTEGGSYYATERQMTIKNADAALRCIQSDGIRTVNRIVEISTAGRAPKNDQAIFALALAAKKGDSATRKVALNAVGKVCRTGTHLFQFAENLQGFGGWGRGTKRAMADWYLSKSADDLAYQVIKYRQRNGWTHRDVLRLAHPKTDSSVVRFAAGKPVESPDTIIEGFIRLQSASSVNDAVAALAACPGLPWEAVPSQFLSDQQVWAELLPRLPLTALIRNLGRMSAYGLLAPMSAAVKIVTDRLASEESIRRARIHPIAVLAAMLTYKNGTGNRGSKRENVLTWTPVPQVIDALNDAFYAAFGNVEASSKRVLLALDISGSMGIGAVAGVPGLTPRVASAAMALITAKVETDYHIVGFSCTGDRVSWRWGNKIVPLSISKRMRLDGAVGAVSELPFGRTDCALPMLYALENKLTVDAFVVYTDSETWAGKVHPSQALTKYRRETGIPAKLIVVGMVANNFSVADPEDAGMLDVVGFDTATPQLITGFVKHS